ncbi:hypothetical protein LS684_03390 [Cytobacillus spongiae]|uniref:hypothetical protein n=1 Tax=Cytobacillus spongiae TaxID=2901381 RepID=UPI001F1E5CCA|nr:hypothetical protein [Cytobacillus spongiae]UII56540.1 hypothetical protein LS684_03390 [Cytobacillus spongiae]
MSCFKLTPYKFNENIYLYPEKILPATNYDDYYVNLMEKSLPISMKKNKSVTRRSLPKIDAMLDWGVVNEGDIIVAKDRGNEGVLQANGNVLVNDEEVSM